MFPILVIGAIVLLVLSRHESASYPVEGSGGYFYRIVVRKGGSLNGSRVDQDIYERKGETGSYYMMILSSTMGINPDAKPIFVRFGS